MDYAPTFISDAPNAAGQLSGERRNIMDYIVYEVFPDGTKFFRMGSCDRIDCEVYVNNHQYDHKVSKLIIKDRKEERNG